MHLQYIGILEIFIGYDVDCEERVHTVDELQLCEKALDAPAAAVVLRNVPVVCSTSQLVFIPGIFGWIPPKLTISPSPNGCQFMCNR